MWYFMLATGIYLCVYTVSYGVWEWKNNNKPAAVVICIGALAAVAVPAIKIFM